MSKSLYSEKELNLIKYYSVKQPLMRLVTFYVCVLAAPISFAVYGVFNEDPLAIFVAFTGLLVFTVWYISSSMKNEEEINSIFNKVLENEADK